MPSTATICLGISHRSAPLAVREAVSCPSAALARALFESEALSSAIHEWAILATCNRYELYARVDDDLRSPSLLAWLGQAGNFSVDQFKPYFYVHYGGAVARHLMRVAAGLDSQVLGEPQILGQVAEALAQGQDLGTVGPHLSLLFQAAVRAGKRARNQTAIGRHPASISSVAVAQIEALPGALADPAVLVIGAGDMAGLAVNALRKRGVSRLTVVNRSPARGQALVADGPGEYCRLERLASAMIAADVVVSATSAPHLILTRGMVARAMNARPDRPLNLIDIAVPRDIDPAAAGVPGVTLVNMDSLDERTEAGRRAREAEVPAVEAIVAEEHRAWRLARRQLRVRPVIRELRQKAEVIRQREVDRALKRLGTTDPATRKQLRQLSRALVNQLLHEPTCRLRDAASRGEGDGLTLAMKDLFDL